MVTIVTTPLVLMNQDLKLFLMVPKQEKIAAVRLIENQEERPLTPSLDSQKEFF